jgi:hypothetical protein
MARGARLSIDAALLDHADPVSDHPDAVRAVRPPRFAVMPAGPAPAAGSDHRMEFEKFLLVLKALDARGVEDVLVGGVAVGVHGPLPATEGIDLFVRSPADNLARLKQRFKPSGMIRRSTPPPSPTCRGTVPSSATALPARPSSSI